ncbi:MAG: hypothetical protein AB4038_05895 [Prochloraceae cyanobacterium]
MSLLLILSIASLIISLITVALIQKYFSQQLLDIPNERSSHTLPTPRGGGLGFIVAFTITSAIATILLGATVTIALLNNNSNPIQAWSALAIVLPLVGDAIYTLCSRLMRRENIFKAHRTHIYQRLQRLGWSHGQVAIIYICLNLLIAASISTFQEIGAWASLVGILLAIIFAEIYLQFSRRKSLKIYNSNYTTLPK